MKASCLSLFPVRCASGLFLWYYCQWPFRIVSCNIKSGFKTITPVCSRSAEAEAWQKYEHIYENGYTLCMYAFRINSRLVSDQALIIWYIISRSPICSGAPSKSKDPILRKTEVKTYEYILIRFVRATAPFAHYAAPAISNNL